MDIIRDHALDHLIPQWVTYSNPEAFTHLDRTFVVTLITMQGNQDEEEEPETVLLVVTVKPERAITLVTTQEEMREFQGGELDSLPIDVTHLSSDQLAQRVHRYTEELARRSREKEGI